MNKKEKYYIELSKITEKYLETDDKRLILDYFINNSNLPGRRANLELAYAFADICEQLNAKHRKKLN